MNRIRRAFSQDRSKRKSKRASSFFAFDGDDGAGLDGDDFGSIARTMPSSARRLLKSGSTGSNACDIVVEERLVTSLLSAARSGDVKGCQACLDEGTDPDGYSVGGADEDGTTAAHLASFSGKIGVLQLLLSHGANLNPKDINGFSPAHLAAHNGNCDILEFLSACGVKLSSCVSPSGCTLTHMAAMGGHIDAMHLLHRYGCDVNAVTAKGNTPMQLAQQYGHTELCRVLDELMSTTIEHATSSADEASSTAAEAGLNVEAGSALGHVSVSTDVPVLCSARNVVDSPLLSCAAAPVAMPPEHLDLSSGAQNTGTVVDTAHALTATGTPQRHGQSQDTDPDAREAKPKKKKNRGAKPTI